MENRAGGDSHGRGGKFQLRHRASTTTGQS